MKRTMSSTAANQSNQTDQSGHSEEFEEFPSAPVLRRTTTLTSPGDRQYLTHAAALGRDQADDQADGQGGGARATASSNVSLRRATTVWDLATYLNIQGSTGEQFLTVNCFGIHMDSSEVKPVLEMSDGTAFCKKGITAYIAAMNLETDIGRQVFTTPDLTGEPGTLDEALVAYLKDQPLHAVFDVFATNYDLVAADRWHQADGPGSTQMCAYDSAADFHAAFAKLLPAARQKYADLLCGGKGGRIFAMFKSMNLWADADLDEALAAVRADKQNAVGANRLVRIFATAQVLHAAAQTLALCGDASPFTSEQVAEEMKCRVEKRRGAGQVLCEGVARAVRENNVAVFTGQEVTPSVRKCLKEMLGPAFSEHCPPELSGTDTFMYTRNDVFKRFPKTLKKCASVCDFAWPGLHSGVQGADLEGGGGGGGGSPAQKGRLSKGVGLFANPLLDQIPFARDDAFRECMAHALFTSKTECRKVLDPAANFCTALQHQQTGRVVIVAPLHLPSNGEQTPAAIYALQALRFLYNTDVVGVGDLNNTAETHADVAAAIDHCGLDVAPFMKQMSGRKNRFETTQLNKAGKTVEKWSDGVVSTLRSTRWEVFTLDRLFHTSHVRGGNVPQIDNYFFLPTSTHPTDHLCVLVTLNFDH